MNKKQTLKSTWIHFLWLKIFVKTHHPFNQKKIHPPNDCILISIWFWLFDFCLSVDWFFFCTHQKTKQKHLSPHSPLFVITLHTFGLIWVNRRKIETTKINTHSYLYTNNSSISKCIRFVLFGWSFYVQFSFYDVYVHIHYISSDSFAFSAYILWQSLCCNFYLQSAKTPKVIQCQMNDEKAINRFPFVQF